MHLPWVCMQAPCQLLFFANSPAHQRAVGPLRPFMPHIGVIDCLFVVRCFCVCTIVVHVSGKSPVFFPIPGCRCRSGLTRRHGPAAQRWPLLARAKKSGFVFLLLSPSSLLLRLAPSCSVLLRLAPSCSVLLRLAPSCSDKNAKLRFWLCQTESLLSLPALPPLTTLNTPFTEEPQHGQASAR